MICYSAYTPPIFVYLNKYQQFDLIHDTKYSTKVHVFVCVYYITHMYIRIYASARIYAFARVYTTHTFVCVQIRMCLA